MSTTFSFTIESINKLEAREDGKPYRVMDSKVRGLSCAVSGKGAKSLGFYRSINNRLRTKTICSWNDGVSIADARDIVGRWNTAFANGQNPFEISREQREC